jgi:hypothetical protein
LSHNLISTAVFPTEAFSELSGDAGAVGVLDTVAGGLEFDAVELGVLVFVVFTGPPQEIAKTVVQAISSAFLMADFSCLTDSEIVSGFN